MNFNFFFLIFGRKKKSFSDINTGKIKEYGICKKKVQNLIFRWSFHSDLLYIVNYVIVCFMSHFFGLIGIVQARKEEDH